MNKRIRELVVESGNGLMRDGKLYPHIGIRFEEDWQRFAELIVRECAEAVKNSIWHLPRGYKAVDQAEFVKKHFGVE